MKELYDIGFDEENIKNMLETCREIKELDENDIIKSIDVLKNINCNNNQIKNILISNPFYLCRSNGDILRLFELLVNLGLSDLNLLFDSNPYLLNKDEYEIKDYVDIELKKGKEINDIIDELESSPFIIDQY